jgi:hypothetical protein
MTLVKKVPPTNGKPTAKSSDIVTKDAPELKQEVKPEDLRAVQLPNPTLATNDSPLDERVMKVNVLADLVSRREKLQDSLKKLQSINTATDRHELKITIEDADDEWTTQNTNAIVNCIDTIGKTIQGKILELDAQIKW